MTETNAFAAPADLQFEVLTSKSRDKYGRSVLTFDRVWVDGTRWVARDRHVAAVVTMPKAWVEAYGTRYMLSVALTPAELGAEIVAAKAEGRGPLRNRTTYLASRKAALTLAQRAVEAAPRPAGI